MPSEAAGIGPDPRGLNRHGLARGEAGSHDHLLAEQGVKVQLLEKLDETGGLSRSFDRGGFQLDIGPHAYYAGQAPLYKDWIGAENILDVRGIYGVGYKRRQITTPINPTNLIKNLPVTDAAALALDRRASARR